MGPPCKCYRTESHSPFPFVPVGGERQAQLADSHVGQGPPVNGGRHSNPCSCKRIHFDGGMMRRRTRRQQDENKRDEASRFHTFVFSKRNLRFAGKFASTFIETLDFISHHSHKQQPCSLPAHNSICNGALRFSRLELCATTTGRPRPCSKTFGIINEFFAMN